MRSGASGTGDGVAPGDCGSSWESSIRDGLARVLALIFTCHGSTVLQKTRARISSGSWRRVGVVIFMCEVIDMDDRLKQGWLQGIELKVAWQVDINIKICFVVPNSVRVSGVGVEHRVGESGGTARKPLAQNACSLGTRHCSRSRARKLPAIRVSK